MKKIIIFLIILISLLTISCAYAEENGTNPNDNQNNINPTVVSIEANTNTTDNPDNEKYYWKNPYYPNDEYYFYKNGSVFYAKNNILMNYMLNKDQVDFYLENGYFSYALAYIKAHGGNLTYDEVYNAEGVIGNIGATNKFMFYNNGTLLILGQSRVNIEDAKPIHLLQTTIPLEEMKINDTLIFVEGEEEYSPFGYMFDANGTLIPDPEFPYTFNYTTHIDGSAIWSYHLSEYPGAIQFYRMIGKEIDTQPLYDDHHRLMRLANGEFIDTSICRTDNTTDLNNTKINKTNSTNNINQTNNTIPNKTNQITNNTQKTINLENSYQTNNTNQKQTYENNTNQTNNTAANNKKNTKPAQNTSNLIFIPALACLLAPIGLYRKNKK